MTHILTTSDVSSHKRLEYWADMISTAYVKLECDKASPKRFFGSIRSHLLPCLEVSYVKSTAQHVIRTSQAISHSADEWFIVSIQMKGTALIKQDGRQALLLPGDFALYDSQRPYQLVFDSDFEQIVLKFRAEQLQLMVREIDQLTALKVSHECAVGRLLYNAVNVLEQEGEQLTNAAGAAVGNSVINLLAAGLQSLPACHQTELSSLSAYHLERAQLFIKDHLHDPALTVQAVANALQMSGSHLHRLFRDQALTPSQYLWNQRLEACSRELLDQRRTHVTLAQIAFSWGFNDAAHFSRAFKNKFGCSPRQWRQQGHNIERGPQHH